MSSPLSHTATNLFRHSLQLQPPLHVLHPYWNPTKEQTLPTQQAHHWDNSFWIFIFFYEQVEYGYG